MSVKKFFFKELDRMDRDLILLKGLMSDDWIRPTGLSALLFLTQPETCL